VSCNPARSVAERKTPANSGECCQIGCLVYSFHASCFDTREVEQGVDETQQTGAIAIYEFELLRGGRREMRLAAGEQILERTQHQRERRAELVADIAEKCSLGAVNLGESLGSSLFFLIGTSRGDAGRDLSSDEIEKSRVADVEWPVGFSAITIAPAGVS
jgi:hypothetical protein